MMIKMKRKLFKSSGNVSTIKRHHPLDDSDAEDDNDDDKDENTNFSRAVAMSARSNVIIPLMPQIVPKESAEYGSVCC